MMRVPRKDVRVRPSIIPPQVPRSGSVHSLAGALAFAALAGCGGGADAASATVATSIQDPGNDCPPVEPGDIPRIR